MSDKPYHVLITRLSAIGDCVLTMPVATALKQLLPSVKISWCVSCAARELLERCPDIDEVIPVDKRWLKRPREWSRMRERLRRTPIDCVIDPQSLTKSALLGRLSRAPLRIGFNKPHGRELAPWIHSRTLDAPADLHLVDAQLSLLRALDLEPPQGTFRLQIPESTMHWARHHIHQITESADPVLINPGAGWDSRMWPVERYGQVAKWLMKSYQIPSCVVWAGSEEREAAAEIHRISDGAASIAPPTNLVELAALLQTGKFLLTADTGPLHIAVAVGTRCLSLHGPTNPRWSGPYGDGHVSIRKVQFDGSSRVRRTADDWSMRAIEVDDVCAAIDTMLDSRSKTAA